MGKVKEDRELDALVERDYAGNDGSFTAAEILAAYKAALQDFVRGKTNRKSVDVLAKLLAGALAARRQMVAERDSLTSQRCHQYFYN